MVFHTANDYKSAIHAVGQTHFIWDIATAVRSIKKIKMLAINYKINFYISTNNN